MPSYFIIGIFFGLNLFWFIALWSIGFNNEKLSPKFISSSYIPNSHYEFESVVLNSLFNVFSEYFPPPNIITKQIGDLPNGNFKNNFSKEFEIELEDKLKRLYTDNLIKNKTNSKFEMIIDIDKKIIILIKIYTDYRTYKSEIRLFYIPLDNFIINNKYQYDIYKSIIKEAWKMDFPGVIKDYKLSFDKKFILIYYIITKNNVITRRFRYLTLNLSNNYFDSIKKQMDILNKEYNLYINDSLNIEEKFFYSLYDFQSFDDFPIDGNKEITSIEIKKNYIIYSRESNKILSFLFRNNTTNKWFNLNFNENKDLKEPFIYFSRINSLRFIDNKEENDTNKTLSIFQQSLQITEKGIYVFGDIYLINLTDFTLLKDNIIKSQLDKPTSNNNVTLIYNMKLVLKKINKILGPNVFSNNILYSNKTNLIFEFFQGTLCYLSQQDYQIKLIDDLDNKIDFISSDHTNENVIAQYSNGDILYYFQNDDKISYELGQHLYFKSIPMEYREKNILTFSLEKTKNNKTIMLILMENGVIISLDFSKIIQKMKRTLYQIMIDDYSGSIFILIVANIIILIVYLKKSGGRRRINDFGNVFNNIIQVENRNINLIPANMPNQNRPNIPIPNRIIIRINRNLNIQSNVINHSYISNQNNNLNNNQSQNENLNINQMGNSNLIGQNINNINPNQ